MNNLDLTNNIEKRLIRFSEMIPCKTAFIDARTPGSDKKENFCLIGEGVAENPDQVVHIDIPHGFNIGAARQPKGCKNSHHSHDTEEVFMIHSGEWMFTWGEHGEDGNIVLSAGDTISLPRHMFRGFENVGPDNGLMFSILGLDETGTAGHVTWAPYVFEDAKSHGLVLLEDGRLIDTAAGASIPDNSKELAPPNKEELAALSRLDDDDIKKCISSQEHLGQHAIGGLSAIGGIQEYAIIGPENSQENIGAGKMDWLHGFHLRRVRFDGMSHIPNHTRAEEEVIIVQSGNVDITISGKKLSLTKGDLLSIPIGAERSLSNSSHHMADLMVIRRGNSPAPAQFL